MAAVIEETSSQVKLTEPPAETMAQLSIQNEKSSTDSNDNTETDVNSSSFDSKQKKRLDKLVGK